MIRLLSLFTGIGAFESALKSLNIPYELVGFSEVDKFAIKSYCAIHNVDENKNLGDVKNIKTENLKEVDFMTWGFPCQDISIAGNLKGIEKGKTRSGLYFEGYRILKDVMPKVSIIENVKNLTSKRFREKFVKILQDIEDAGYNNYWRVLNAKDYGVPQNVSYPNNTKKRGRVGKQVSQTILASNNNMATLEKVDDKNIAMFNPYNNSKIEDVAPTQTAHCGGIYSSAAVLISEDGEYYFRIRKLTPKECWRLMGFQEDDFVKARSIGMSDTQLYKQAGNSIVVNVLVEIFKKLIFEDCTDIKF